MMCKFLKGNLFLVGWVDEMIDTQPAPLGHAVRHHTQRRNSCGTVGSSSFEGPQSRKELNTPSGVDIVP